MAAAAVIACGKRFAARAVARPTGQALRLSRPMRALLPVQGSLCVLWEEPVMTNPAIAARAARVLGVVESHIARSCGKHQLGAGVANSRDAAEKRQCNENASQRLGSGAPAVKQQVARTERL